jgi:hypothetical protein
MLGPQASHGQEKTQQPIRRHNQLQQETPLRVRSAACLQAALMTESTDAPCKETGL